MTSLSVSFDVPCILHSCLFISRSLCIPFLLISSKGCMLKRVMWIPSQAPASFLEHVTLHAEGFFPFDMSFRFAFISFPFAFRSFHFALISFQRWYAQTGRAGTLPREQQITPFRRWRPPRAPFSKKGKSQRTHQITSKMVTVTSALSFSCKF